MELHDLAPSLQGGVEPDELLLSSKFQWFNRLGCVEDIAQALADQGGKYEAALRSVRLSQYAYRVSKMTGRQKTELRRDVSKRVKDLLHMRESADVGDTVRVPKLVPHPLLGGYMREGRRLVEAVIVSKQLLSGTYRYTVCRVEDNQTQTGNGHMIKSIVSRSKGERC